jgi:hypothetical protein
MSLRFAEGVELEMGRHDGYEAGTPSAAATSPN